MQFSQRLGHEPLMIRGEIAGSNVAEDGSSRVVTFAGEERHAEVGTFVERGAEQGNVGFGCFCCGQRFV